MNDRLLQFCVFVATLVGYVILAVAGEATAEYVALVGPVLAVVIMKTHLDQQDKTLKKQDRVLTEIHENTNGKLDRRIQSAIERAIPRALESMREEEE